MSEFALTIHERADSGGGLQARRLKMFESGPEPTSSLPPILAIHGVGAHRPGEIKWGLESTLARADIAAEVSEFNWDQFVEQSDERTGSSLGLLDQAAESLSNAAALPLPNCDNVFDSRLLQLGDALYHGIFRVLVATALTLLLVGPLLQLVILLPQAVFVSISWNAFGWIWSVSRYLMAAVIAVYLVLLTVDVVRATVTLSLAPLLLTMRRGLLLILQPFVLLVTVPLSAEVGVASTMATLPLAAGTAVLSLVVSPLGGVTGQTLLDTRNLLVIGVVVIVVAALGESRRVVVIVADSLGSVIAIDSLVNSPVWNDTNKVRLITLGSPLKRFFIRFFPRYLFPPEVATTARLAAARLHELSWINIHRRWDYVGTSFGAGSGLSADLSTGQGWRIR